MTTRATWIATASVSLLLFVPAFARANDVPTLSITMSYESNGEYIPVYEGGSYDIPTNTSVWTRHDRVAANSWGAFFYGELGNAKYVGNFSILDSDIPFSPRENGFVHGEGDYFLVMYDIQQPGFVQDFRDYYATWMGTPYRDSGPPGKYPPKWGILRFKIQKRPPCCSNVLFIPGFQGSRLYERMENRTPEVWPPNKLQNSVYHLYLDEQGNSLYDIFTKEDGVIASITTPFATQHFYTKILESLQALVASSTIQAFRTYPYDWRQDALAIVDHGTPYEFERKYPIDLIESLASTSQTGKVTLIGHSYGGVLAKAIAYRMEQRGRSHLLDQVVMVGSPQLGTPKAAASLLHGDFQSIPGWAGFVVSKANARGVSENMKGALNLLPSPQYFTAIAEPVINTYEAPLVEREGGAGGPLIDTPHKFTRFITGAGGRKDPSYLDTSSANVLNSSLVSGAQNSMQSLASWDPATTSIKFVQIAGWGIDTPKNIVYKEVGHKLCSRLTLQCTYSTTTSHTVEMTTDGDGTVVLPSAVSKLVGSKYYADIRKSNAVYDGNFEHGYLLEIPSVVTLLTDLLRSSSTPSLGVSLSAVTPPQATTSRLRLRMHSPADIHVFDEMGRHTGKRSVAADPDLTYLEEDIPGSYYAEIDEVKEVVVPDNARYRIYLDGTGIGTFTFELERLQGTVAHPVMRYVDVPVTASTSAYIDVFQASGIGPMKIDVEGDGVTDENINMNGGLPIPALFKMVRSAIMQSDMSERAHKRLLREVDKLEKEFLDIKGSSVKSKLKAVESMESEVRKLHERGDIADVWAEYILTITAQLRERIS